ncbi:hypothetical protein TNCV_277781 [Trichonephila clavipes]|nr:hypothetical protein TNCV_277781 [Trichonephila clavipes]
MRLSCFDPAISNRDQPNDAVEIDCRNTDLTSSLKSDKEVYKNSVISIRAPTTRLASEWMISPSNRAAAMRSGWDCWAERSQYDRLFGRVRIHITRPIWRFARGVARTWKICYDQFWVYLEICTGNYKEDITFRDMGLVTLCTGFWEHVTVRPMRQLGTAPSSGLRGYIAPEPLSARRLPYPESPGDPITAAMPGGLSLWRQRWWKSYRADNAPTVVASRKIMRRTVILFGPWMDYRRTFAVSATELRNDLATMIFNESMSSSDAAATYLIIGFRSLTLSKKCRLMTFPILPDWKPNDQASNVVAKGNRLPREAETFYEMEQNYQVNKFSYSAREGRMECSTPSPHFSSCKSTRHDTRPRGSERSHWRFSLEDDRPGGTHAEVARSHWSVTSAFGIGTIFWRRSEVRPTDKTGHRRTTQWRRHCERSGSRPPENLTLSPTTPSLGFI